MSLEPIKKFAVKISADPLTEVFAIGNKYRLLGRGVGGLNLDLPRGRYLIKYRKGADTRQVPLHVTKTTQLRLGPSSKSGPEKGWLDNFSEEFAKAFLQVAQPMQWPEQGTGNLTLFLSDKECALNKNINLSLRTPTGKRITLSDAEQRTKNTWGVRLNLSPGIYILRTSSQHIGSHEMALYVGNRSQTIVSLSNRSISAFTGGRRAIDLGLTSIQIGAYDGAQHVGPDEAMRLWATTDFMRDAMAFRRNTMPPKELTNALYDKFGCPLMGLLGAHLLLLGKDIDQNLLSIVVNNMETLMPNSPDVAAIRMALNRRTNHRVRPPKISAPPMLEASWQEILKADRRFPGTIQISGFSSRIVPILSAASPWLIWSFGTSIGISEDDLALAKGESFNEYVSVLAKRKKGKVYEYQQDKRVEEIASRFMVPKIQVARRLKSMKFEPAHRPKSIEL